MDVENGGKLGQKKVGGLGKYLTIFNSTLKFFFCFSSKTLKKMGGKCGEIIKLQICPCLPHYYHFISSHRHIFSPILFLFVLYFLFPIPSLSSSFSPHCWSHFLSHPSISLLSYIPPWALLLCIMILIWCVGLAVVWLGLMYRQCSRTIKFGVMIGSNIVWRSLAKIIMVVKIGG